MADISASAPKNSHRPISIKAVCWTKAIVATSLPETNKFEIRVFHRQTGAQQTKTKFMTNIIGIVADQDV